MTAEDYLGQWRGIDARIGRLLADLASLQAAAERMTTVLRHDRGSGARDPRAGENAAAALADARTEIGAEVAGLIELKLEISRTVDAVADPVLWRLLARRYLDGRDWFRVADELGVSLASVHRLHRKALDAVRVPDGTRR